MSLLLEVKRITSESRVFRLRLVDDVITEDGAKLIVIRRNTENNTEVIVQEFSCDSVPEHILLIKSENTRSYDFTDECDKYSSQFCYRIVKKIDDDIQDYTDFVYCKTAPQKVSDLQIDQSQSVYDGNNIPTSIGLRWTPLDTVDDNICVIGYNIYFSQKQRVNGTWSEWVKVRGASTSDKSSSFTLVKKDQSSIVIATKELSLHESPMDLRFAVVAVDNSINQQQSRFSNIISFILENSSSQLINETQKQISYYEREEHGIDALRVRVNFRDGSFPEEAVVFISKTDFVPNNAVYTLNKPASYKITANKEFTGWATVSIYADLFHNQKYELLVFDEKTNKWVQTPAVYNTILKCLTFTITKLSSFTLILKGKVIMKKSKYNKEMAERFANHTSNILKKLPSWFKMRRDPINSTGAHFLNIFGLEFDDMEFILNYAYEQTSISKLDMEQIDIIYSAKLPEAVDEDSIISIKSRVYVLDRVTNLPDFLRPSELNSLRPKTFYNNPYIIDYEDKVIYVKKPYDKTFEKEYGVIKLEIYDKEDDNLSSSIDLDLNIHHVWNFFDEFGMLLDTPRLVGEPNLDYKERILDVFKNKSSSTKEGLLNGVARELGMRVNRIWEDTSEDFYIKEPMVTVNMIKINGELVDTSNIYFTSQDYIVIKGNDEIPRDSEVTYVCGIEMHTFHNKEDYIFRQQLLNIDGTATNLFKHYVNTIKQEVPVEWGQFRWNQGYWDIADENMSGYGFLPSILDGLFTGFRNYKPAHK